MYKNYKIANLYGKQRECYLKFCILPNIKILLKQLKEHLSVKFKSILLKPKRTNISCVRQTSMISIGPDVDFAFCCLSLSFRAQRVGLVARKCGSAGSKLEQARADEAGG